MKQSENYITEEKYKALKIELEQLKGPKRKEILDTLAYAKSLGDLSENAEYHQAREDQGKLEERIRKVEEILMS
ncbi:transcription elongation factor GreA, partial [Candidatus Nomurabacteria bacterium CG10_big_fil_rev_8_21_14_0_10_03_31_7]